MLSLNKYSTMAARLNIESCTQWSLDETAEAIHELVAEVELYRELIDRIVICCGELHHNPQEYHESGKCPVMKRFESILKDSR